ncbi:hypothetical protein FGM00_04015 [Aggregatimonas sangjinii]|uniref:Uncharacterized protein n=2 Tax=Aggregatimonas sangjinii TaxID=2583587 RepID=A0A5B7SLI8_9FLAO|nr:hypothetical protein FGM00_04015 [Aggregatimonas sangjinii]
MGKLVQLQNDPGTPIKKKFQKNMATKKFRYRLTDFKSNYYVGRKPVYNSKCNFEVHSAGLMLSGNFCNNYKHISILSQEVESVTLVRGKETIDTFYMSPIHMLSKIGVPKRISRYFSFHPSEYKITETKILIEGKEQRLELITSGYSFEKLKRHFKKRGYGDKLKIERGPSMDLSSFRSTIPEAEARFLK